MKIELKREQTISGDVFYRICMNEDNKESFYAGHISNEDFEESDKRMYDVAKKLYDQIVAYGSDAPKITIIESTEI